MENTLNYLLRNVSLKYRHYAYNLLGKDRWGVSLDLAIYHIAQEKELNQKDLVIKLNITPASVSSIANQMESQGLIKRVQDEKDGLRFILSLTEKGQNLVSSVVYAWTEIRKRQLRDLLKKRKQHFFVS